MWDGFSSYDVAGSFTIAGVPAVGPVLEDRLHDGDGLMGKKVAAAGRLESE